MAELIIYRNGNPFTTVKIGEELVYNGQFMGENKVVGSFDTSETKDFFIGDYILHNGQKYILNELPELLREAKNIFSYGAVFESEEYSLYNKLLRHLKVSDFSYFGKPQQFIDLILDNYNEISSGWTSGDIDDVDEGINIPFQEDSCRTALQKVVDAFEMEFKIDPILKKIHVKKSIGQLLPDVVFRYGMGNGLYNLTRQPAADTKVYTRFYGFGSTKNLPATYRSGTKRLIFEDESVDRNVSVYGVRETAVVFEDIFPQRSAPITAINGDNEITDSSLDFNLNNVVVDGQAKIVFKNGELGGNEFLIVSYNHTTKTIKYKPNKDENGYILPNDTVKPSVGDIYTLVGIEMPQSYIDAAELLVKERTEEFADIYKDPQFAFSLSIDEKFIRTNNLLGIINPGDRVAVEDTEMEVDTTLRVQAISYPISNPGKIQATINDKITYSLADKIKKYIAKQAQDIIVVNRNLAETGRDLSIRQQEFQNAVYDPDGYFDGTRIKPNTIEAISIKTGVRSQQFTLGVIFRFNYLADPNTVQWTSGQLVHNTIDPTSTKTWNIAGNLNSGLNSTSLYYIFAKCSKSTNDGIIILDTVQHLVDGDPNHYYFLIGMVSSSISGVRWPSLTYGTTELNGRFITTGKIQSQDGNTSFDLDSGIIKGKITFGENGVSTVVDGNLVTTSSIILGNGIVNNAGITGLGTLTNDIRFWAGADFSSKSSAPFRVDQSGHLFASNATISGHIEATSGTIAGVSINATDLFNLDGSKVKIFPDKGIRVLDGGYFSLPKIAPATADMPMSEWCMYITEAATPSGTPPIVISRFIDLLDVDATGRLQDFVVYWDAATAKHRYKAASFAPAGDVYTKSEINNFFGGVTAMTGYNKSSWDSAFGWGNHAGLYQPIEDQRLSTGDEVSFQTLTVNDLYSYVDLRAAGNLLLGGTAQVDVALALYNGVGSRYTTVTAQNINADITLLLPNAPGTLALVSQIPTNVVQTTGAYANPTWLTSLAYSKLSGAPTLLSQFTNDLGNYGGFAYGYEVALKQDKITSTGYAYYNGTNLVSVNGSLNDMLLANGGFTSINPRVRNVTFTAINPDNTAIVAGNSIQQLADRTQGQLNNKANVNGSNASGTWGINISGTATTWAGKTGDLTNLGTSLSYLYGSDYANGNAARAWDASQVKAFLGLPSGGAYNLQWITNNGGKTTNAIQVTGGNGSGFGKGIIVFYEPSYGSDGAGVVQAHNYNTDETLPLILNATGGKVGIGTASPSEKLQVNGNIIAAAGNQKIIYDILENYGSSLKINAAGGLPLLLQNNGSSVMAIVGGNVGIGTAAPNYKLDVSGALAGSRVIAGYDSGIEGSVNASAWFRSTGNTGWYNSTYDGGWYMTDSTWIRSYNNKGLLVSGSIGIQAEKIQVNSMLVFPKADPVIADMPVDQWVAYIKEVI